MALKNIDEIIEACLLADTDSRRNELANDVANVGAAIRSLVSSLSGGCDFGIEDWPEFRAVAKVAEVLEARSEQGLG